mgnify:CR=1 FL=1
MKRLSFLSHSFFTLSFAILAGCSTTQQVVVPADISDATNVIVATDRSAWSGAMADETFTLGQYKVIEVDRDWDSSSSSALTVSKLKLASGKTKGGYAYKLQTSTSQLSGVCSSKLADGSLGMSGITISTKDSELNCVCSAGKSDVSTVMVQADASDEYTGTLQAGGQSYKVVSLKERAGVLSMGPSGYRVDSDKPVGAVEVLKPGRIWLGKSLGQADKDALACSFVGLMLYLPAN